MNLGFYSDPIEKEIVTEVMRWSEEVLSIPSPLFNNLPAVPLRKKIFVRAENSANF